MSSGVLGVVQCGVRPCSQRAHRNLALWRAARRRGKQRAAGEVAFMKHTRTLTITALATVAGMFLASPAVASTTDVSHTRSGNATESGLTVYYRYGCVNITDKTDSNGPQAYYSPTWDFKVVETGQTAWQYVRVGYLWRQFDETWYYNA